MKRLIIISMLLLTIAKAHINEQRMLDAIAYAERSHGKIGKHGEFSDWQIKPSTWYQYSNINIPISSYTQQRTVALTILRDYERILVHRRIEVTPHNLALAWNAGPYATRYTTLNELYAYRVMHYYTIP